MKRFRNEWMLEAIQEHPTYFSKGMFGGLAVYLFERQMLLLVEPTKSGRWNWHGVLVCTGYEHHASLQAEFPALKPHRILGKWLYIDTADEAFDGTMLGVAAGISENDPRFGIVPAQRKKGTSGWKKKSC